MEDSSEHKPEPSDQDTADNRRSRTQTLAKKLVTQRTEVLVLFCRAAGLGTEKSEKSAEQVLKEFCEVLVDYIAAGHFTLYDRIAAGKERRRRVREIAEETYPTIANTTQRVVDFNDKYEDPARVSNTNELMQDLSLLGEQLAIRIELEDRLLSSLD